MSQGLTPSVVRIERASIANKISKHDTNLAVVFQRDNKKLTTNTTSWKSDKVIYADSIHKEEEPTNFFLIRRLGIRSWV